MPETRREFNPQKKQERTAPSELKCRMCRKEIHTQEDLQTFRGDGLCHSCAYNLLNN
jgi:hypothetical protein